MYNFRNQTYWDLCAAMALCKRKITLGKWFALGGKEWLIINRTFWFTLIVRFCSYVTIYQYEAESRLTGKSKSWMYFLIILTDSNIYSLQSEIELTLYQSAIFVRQLNERYWQGGTFFSMHNAAIAKYKEIWFLCRLTPYLSNVTTALILYISMYCKILSATVSVGHCTLWLSGNSSLLHNRLSDYYRR